MLAPYEALQDAGYLVEREFEIPSLGAACPGEEETEEDRIEDEQMDGDGDGHDVVENGMDGTQEIIPDLGSGVSGEFLFIQHDLHIFVRVDDDVSVDELVNDFQIIGDVCVVKDDGAFDMDILIQNDVVANDQRPLQGAVMFDTDIVPQKNGVLWGMLSFFFVVESTASHNDRRTAEDDIVL